MSVGGYAGTVLGTNANNAGNPQRQQELGYLNEEGQNLPTYNAVAGQQGNNEQLFNKENVAAVQGLGDYLGRSTSDQARQQYIANATQNVAGTAQQAQANAQASLASRGLGGSAGAAGAVLAGSNAQAGATSAAANQADQFFLQQHQQNLGQLANLYGGATQTALGNQMGATGAAANLEGNLSGGYGGIANQEYALQAQQNQAAQAGFGDIVGGIGDIIGMGAGVPGVGGAAKAGGGVPLPPIPSMASEGTGGYSPYNTGQYSSVPGGGYNAYDPASL